MSMSPNFCTGKTKFSPKSKAELKSARLELDSLSLKKDSLEIKLRYIETKIGSELMKEIETSQLLEKSDSEKNIKRKWYKKIWPFKKNN